MIGRACRRRQFSINVLGIFVPALAEDCAKHGPAVIESVRIGRPSDYFKIISGLLPKDVNLNVRPLDHLSDEQALARLAQLMRFVRPVGCSFRAGSSDPSRPGKSA